MRRGDFVLVAIAGNYGKPRPALVIQSDRFDAMASFTVLLVSSTVVDAPLLRIGIDPSPENGLRLPTQIMIDKLVTVRRERIGDHIGRATDEQMLTVTRSLAIFLGIG